MLIAHIRLSLIFDKYISIHFMTISECNHKNIEMALFRSPPVAVSNNHFCCQLLLNKIILVNLVLSDFPLILLYLFDAVFVVNVLVVELKLLIKIDVVIVVLVVLVVLLVIISVVLFVVVLVIIIDVVVLVVLVVLLLIISVVFAVVVLVVLIVFFV